MSLISYAYFRDFNGVSQNIEDSDLRTKIFKAEQELKFLIGKEFYDQLVTQYEASDDTTGFTADNLAFYDPYLKQWIAKQSFVYLVSENFSVTRTGLRVFTEEQSSSGSDKLIGEVIKTQKQEAEQYKGRMFRFLRNAQKLVSTKYPLYVNTCGSEKIASSFSITAVSKCEDVYVKVSNEVIYGS